MLYEEVKAASDRVNDAYNRHDAEALAALHAPDYIAHTSVVPGGVLNRDAAVMMWRALWQAFPDMHNEIVDEVIQGDKVAIRLVVTGTHRAEFQGIPATGKKMGVTVMDIIRYEDGLAKEEWYEYNMLVMLQQLGVMPPQAA